jgi:hypothetical protein
MLNNHCFLKFLYSFVFHTLGFHAWLSRLGFQNFLSCGSKEGIGSPGIPRRTLDYEISDLDHLISSKDYCFVTCPTNNKIILIFFFKKKKSFKI